MELKSRIIEEAKNLFMKFGIKCISMDDISQKLGISKKTLYQEVSDKNALVKEVFDNILSCEREDFSQIFNSSDDAIEEMFKLNQYVIQMVGKLNPSTLLDLEKYYNSMYQELKSYQFDFIYKVIKNNLDKGIRDGLYRDDMNTDLVAKLYLIKSMSLMREEMFPVAVYSKTTIFVEHVIYHLRGIISEKGKEILNKYIQTIQ